MKLFAIKTFRRCALTFALLSLCANAALAQTVRSTNAPTAPAQPPARPAPQVVTVIHRLNGIKVLRLLRRSNAAAGASVEVEDQTFTTRDVHTTILAGLTLDDGRTIVTRLPQAVAEVETEVRTSDSSNNNQQQQPSTVSVSRTVTADITVMQRSGQQTAARYIGWDGATGFSLIEVNQPFPTPTRDASEASITTGERVRLIAPLPVARQREASAPNSLPIRIAEIDGEIVEVRRRPQSKITSLLVRAHDLSEEVVGGVALNEAGETVGIVESASGEQARIVPIAIVRRAAERVMARRASVPRPWLGVRGEPVSATSLLTIQSNGWTQEEANALKLAQQGILITNVTPGTPAALANLQPGDIIWRVNDAEIRSAEDFSFTLGEAGVGASVQFTVLRGAQGPQPSAPQLPANMRLPAQLAPIKPMSFVIKLSEAFDPMMTAEMAAYGGLAQPGMNLAQASADPWTNYGLETIALGERTARRLGAQSGLIVVSVQPDSVAARAGLKPADVIESVNGRLLPEGNALLTESNVTANNLKLVIVRDGQPLEIVIPPQRAR